MSLPTLNPEAMESRKRSRRIQLILESFKDTPQGTTFLRWLCLPEEAVQRRLAECAEPLLKRAEEGELWTKN